MLYRYREILPSKTKLKLCESLIISGLDYCDVVYHKALNMCDANRLQKLQNSCLRFCNNIHSCEHITPHYNQVGLLKLNLRRELHYKCFIHRIIQKNLPNYLANKIKQRNQCHSVNIRSGSNLDLPTHNTQKYRCSFSYMAPKLYNSLEDTTKNLSSASFKFTIKNKCCKANSYCRLSGRSGFRTQPFAPFCDVFSVL